jgi:hypothetical protein
VGLLSYAYGGGAGVEEEGWQRLGVVHPIDARLRGPDPLILGVHLFRQRTLVRVRSLIGVAAGALPSN